MSSKKTLPVEPEAETPPEPDGSQPTGGPVGEQPNEPEMEPVASPTVEELEKQLAETEAHCAEYKDGWQRAVADFQNYRRRMEAEKVSSYQSALGEVIQRYLPILDDLERALAARPADLAWADGIELIYRKWCSLLEAEGVQRIEAVGQPFDPNVHEAVAHEPSDDHESGQVIGIVRNGYMLGERVIRPAQVRVAK